MSDHESNVKVRLGGLWQGKDRNGHAYLSGPVGQARLLVLRNGYKRAGKKDPDFIMYLAPQEKRQDDAAETTPADPWDA
jgi:hypothetical protein